MSPITPISEIVSPKDSTSSGSPLYSLFTPSSVPVNSRSIWYYFGWLTLFLFVAMLGTGILLSVYYVPSTAPTSTAGIPDVLARVTAPFSWNGYTYSRGDLIVLPFNTTSAKLVVPDAVRKQVSLVTQLDGKTPVHPSEAWASVEEVIMRRAAFGSVIRSTHLYCANLLIATLLIHFFSALLLRAYRRPQQMLWVSGIVLLLLVLGSGYSGYILPWNLLSYSATRIGGSLPGEALPLIGSGVSSIALGGTDVGQGTLSRLFSLHAIVLPLAIALAGLVHLILLGKRGHNAGKYQLPDRAHYPAYALAAGALLVLIVGMVLDHDFDPLAAYSIIPLAILPIVAAHVLSVAAGGDKGRMRLQGERAVIPFSRYWYRILLSALFIAGAVLTLALLHPAVMIGEFSFPADLTATIATPSNVHPEWYFMFLYQLLRVAPASVALLIMGAVVLFLFTLPWLDSNSHSGRGRLTFATSLVLLGAFCGLTIWAYIG